MSCLKATKSKRQSWQPEPEQLMFLHLLEESMISRWTDCSWSEILPQYSKRMISKRRSSQPVSETPVMLSNVLKPERIWQLFLTVLLNKCWNILWLLRGLKNSKKTIEQYLEANMEAVDRKTVSTIRVLCADTVEKTNSGHPGLPLRLQF